MHAQPVGHMGSIYIFGNRSTPVNADAGGKISFDYYDE